MRNYCLRNRYIENLASDVESQKKDFWTIIKGLRKQNQEKVFCELYYELNGVYPEL